MIFSLIHSNVPTHSSRNKTVVVSNIQPTTLSSEASQLRTHSEVSRPPRSNHSRSTSSSLDSCARHALHHHLLPHSIYWHQLFSCLSSLKPRPRYAHFPALAMRFPAHSATSFVTAASRLARGKRELSDDPLLHTPLHRYGMNLQRSSRPSRLLFFHSILLLFLGRGIAAQIQCCCFS